MTQTSSQVPTCPLTLVTEHNINCEVGAGSLQGPRDTATTRLPTLHELGNQSPVSSPGCCSSLSTCTPSKHSLLRRFCLSSLSKLTSDSSQFLEKLLNLIGNLEKIWRTQFLFLFKLNYLKISQQFWENIFCARRAFQAAVQYLCKHLCIFLNLLTVGTVFPLTSMLC